MSETAHLSPIDAANLLAGHAVAEAEACLAERRDAADIGTVATLLWQAHDAIARHQPSPEILVPVRLLITTMVRVARADTAERRDRWRRVLAALTDLVRHESLALRARPSLPETVTAIDEVPSCGQENDWARAKGETP